MRLLGLAALALAARLLWRRQLAFEEGLMDCVADMQSETLGLVEEYAEGGHLQPVAANGAHG